MFATKRTGRFFTTANPAGFPATATVGPDGKVSVEAETNEGRQTFADIPSLNHNDANVDGSFFRADKPADPPAEPAKPHAPPPTSPPVTPSRTTGASKSRDR